MKSCHFPYDSKWMHIWNWKKYGYNCPHFSVKDPKPVSLEESQGHKRSWGTFWVIGYKLSQLPNLQQQDIRKESYKTQVFFKCSVWKSTMFMMNNLKQQAGGRKMRTCLSMPHLLFMWGQINTQLNSWVF